MPVKLSTTIKNINLLENPINSKLIFEFYRYLRSNNTSESYQNQNIKALINFAKFLGPLRDYYQLSKKDDILSFLDTKIKSKEIDPDGKWIRTIGRCLLKWMYSFLSQSLSILSISVSFWCIINRWAIYKSNQTRFTSLASTCWISKISITKFFGSASFICNVILHWESVGESVYWTNNQFIDISNDQWL